MYYDECHFGIEISADGKKMAPGLGEPWVDLPLNLADYLELRGHIEVWLEVEELDEQEESDLEELLR